MMEPSLTSGYCHMTSELGKGRWAVISDRGVEATGVTHEDARRLVHRLKGEGRHGLCIISDEAASRLDSVPKVAELQDRV